MNDFLNALIPLISSLFRGSFWNVYILPCFCLCLLCAIFRIIYAISEVR